MKKFVVIFVCCFVVSGFWSGSGYCKTIKTDAFKVALEAAGLSYENISWEASKLSRIDDADPFRLQWFNEIWANPLRVPKIAKQITDRIPIFATNISKEFNYIFFYGTSRTCGSVAALMEDYLPPLEMAKEKPFYNSIKKVYQNMGWQFGKGLDTKLSGYEKQITQEASETLAEYVLSADWLFRERKKALEASDLTEETFRKLLVANAGDEDTGDFTYRLGKRFDMKQTMYACCRIVFSTQKLKGAFGGGVSLPEGKNVFPTPFGDIMLNGSRSDDLYSGDNHLLVVDVGGNDTYEGTFGATSSLYNCASVVIDVSGNDTYKDPYGHSPNQGAGVLGCGILADLWGNDTYEAANNCQGAGVFGIGMLYDYTGNDTYSSVDFSQGAGCFGIGAMIEYDGGDVRKCFFGGQGYGATMGLGLSYDRSGNDTYISDDENIIHPSAQNPSHNTSMSQGCGNGRRADITDGHSMSGGCGVLVDGEGDDTYKCGVFGQGVGYWFGVGIFTDTKGNDTYEGLWYVQGATAHFAIAVFRDTEGNDSYTAKQATSLGVGHDFSTSYHIDEGGDDKYTCYMTDPKDDKIKQYGGLMIGCGNETGMGFFFNIGGNDVYDAKSDNMYGYANVAAPLAPDTIRNDMLCLGLFIDIGGEDTYGKDFCKHNSNWVRKNDDRPEVVIGIGLDAEDGELPILR